MHVNVGKLGKSRRRCKNIIYETVKQCRRLASTRGRQLRQRADRFLKLLVWRSDHFTCLGDGVGGRRSWAEGSAQRTSVAKCVCCSRHCHDIGIATYRTTTTVLYDVGIATYRHGTIPIS